MVQITPFQNATNPPQSALQAEIASLKDLGFKNDREIIRMLVKTNGNVEVVRDFLIARRNFRQAKREAAKSVEPKEDCSKILGKQEKQDERTRRIAVRMEKLQAKHDRLQKLQTEQEVVEDKPIEKPTPMEDWPIGQHLLLDGASLIMALPSLKDLVLQGKTEQVQNILVDMVKEFQEISGASSCTLVMMNGKEIQDGLFRVAATDTRKACNDLLVQLAQELPPRTAIVTCKPGLTQRLLQLNKAIKKPKEMWLAMKKLDGSDLPLNKWVNRWINK
eukprot:TRINITY_DN17222_c0_g1_i1.p1 TRINITY_DN17222_c0_g1~~TRINITY_DN17222_c0_g1_i1.p1  ORF type:complete len:276 (+),score=73.82 TRINITY_DN17222_c0_g1_i1:72-899(+)